jgi:hypothetical protein
VLVPDPVASGTIYAAGDGGVFKSIDAATTWKPARNGITELSIDTVAVDPTNSLVVYAGSNAGGGVYKSIDGGITWDRKVDGLAITTIKSLAVDPLHPSTVYAGTDCCGIYKSLDGASSWTWLTGGGLPIASVSAIAIDPVASSTVYAGLQSNGVYKSTDSGTTWNPASDGLGNTNNLLHALVIDRTAPNALYVGTASTIFRSTDGAAHWTPINGNLVNPQLQSLVADPQTPGTLYVGTVFNGVFGTVDGGTTWTPVNTGVVDKGIRALAIDLQTPSRVYSGTETGVLRTANSGAQWEAANVGLANTAIQAVAADPLNPTIVYAGARRNGVFKSIDGGATWNASSSGLSAANGSNDVLSFAIDPVTSSTIYAGTGKGVYKSVNGGASWNFSSTGLGTPRVLALAIDPRSPLTVHAGTNGFGMYTSNDGGGTWAPNNAGLPDHTVVYALSIAGDTLMLVDPLKGPFFSIGLPVSFFLDTPDPDNEYYAGACAARPAAKRLSEPADVISELACLLAAKFYDVPNSIGFSRSATSWNTPWGPWGPTQGADGSLCTPLATIVTDPSVFGTFFAGGACGVLHGSNNGEQVVAMNAGLPANLQVNALAITTSSDTLYAGDYRRRSVRVRLGDACAQLPGPVVERSAGVGIGLGDQPRASRRHDFRDLVHLRSHRQAVVARRSPRIASAERVSRRSLHNDWTTVQRGPVQSGLGRRDHDRHGDVHVHRQRSRDVRLLGERQRTGQERRRAEQDDHPTAIRNAADVRLGRATGLDHGDELPGPVVEAARGLRVRMGHQFHAPGRRDLRHVVHVRSQRQALVARVRRQSHGTWGLRRRRVHDGGAALQCGAVRSGDGRRDDDRHRIAHVF